MFVRSKLSRHTHSSKQRLPIPDTSSETFTFLNDVQPANTSLSSMDTPLISASSRALQYANAPFSILPASTLTFLRDGHFSKAYFSIMHPGAFITTDLSSGHAENAYLPITTGLSQTNSVTVLSSQKLYGAKSSLPYALSGSRTVGDVPVSNPATSRLTQPLNAASPVSRRLSGTLKRISFLQFSKALRHIF